jgi:uncharacterized DUF497 family protein
VFEWDPVKAARNLRTHGVSFEEASTVFADLDALDSADLLHSQREPRFLRIGLSAIGRVLIVAYTVRVTAHGEAIRIIYTRRANAEERTAYGVD